MKVYKRDFLILTICSVLLAIGMSSCMSNIEWQDHDDFAYQLQGYQFEQLRDSGFSLFIVDVSAAGNSPERIEEFRNAYPGNRRVLCYLSIGEAENYRSYWKSSWGKNPPVFLDKQNPRWRGNFKVKYWEPSWKEILFRSSNSILDNIMDLGFDGVYLDIIDAYEYYEEQGRATAAKEMVELVSEIASYARTRDRNFGIFPQNAEELGINFPEYMNIVNGIGIEDLFYGNPRPGDISPAEWTSERIKILLEWKKAGKLVLTVDYTIGNEQTKDAYEKSRAYDFVPYATELSLGSLRINPGLDPDPMKE